MIFKKKLPEISVFPEGTEFYIKEFDVPLVHTPSNEWFNTTAQDFEVPLFSFFCVICKRYSFALDDS